jgi:hypothetical protein
MALKVVDGGLDILLDDMTDVAAVGKPFRMHLYKNNHTPAHDDDISDYVECTFSGYTGGKDIAFAAAVFVGPQSQVVGTQLNWQHNGGGTANDVYGYFVTDQADAVLIWAERDPAAPTHISSAGDTFSVIPAYTRKSEF